VKPLGLRDIIAARNGNDTACFTRHYNVLPAYLQEMQIVFLCLSRTKLENITIIDYCSKNLSSPAQKVANKI
jgi:hypothetical protein